MSFDGNVRFKIPGGMTAELKDKLKELAHRHGVISDPWDSSLRGGGSQAPCEVAKAFLALAPEGSSAVFTGDFENWEEEQDRGFRYIKSGGQVIFQRAIIAWQTEPDPNSGTT